MCPQRISAELELAAERSEFWAKAADVTCLAWLAGLLRECRDGSR
jgi:hypothetical protein